MLDKFVKLYSKVTLRSNNRSVTYQIVEPHEIDISKNRISCESPVGEALLNKKASDEISVVTPKGKINYKILSVL